MSLNYGTPEAKPAIQLGEIERGAFIMNTYMHVFGAIVAFVALEYYFFSSGIAMALAPLMTGNWLLVLGGFMIVGWLTSAAASRVTSPAMQYLALGGTVVAWAIMFIPMLLYANLYAPGVIQSAGLLTLVGFAGLTMIAFTMRKDFSFLNGILMWGGIAALLLIVGSLIFGFHLGTWFSVAMIALAGGSILRDTSNILHHYPEDRHVAAAVALFGSIAMMFWYILRLLMAMQRD